jgi:uncharacterized membrane protein YbhN (UPF0104 family)
MAPMNRTMWTSARLLGGALTFAVLLWRFGVRPFVDGLQLISAWSLLAASAITVLTTVCCAWRWSLVARNLGASVPLRAAIPAYYRSQFLNTTLPGGVLGDVHRGLRHGVEVGDVGRGLRAVAWERSAGQVVQLAVAIVLLILLPSPVRSTVRSSVPAIAVIGLAGGLGVLLLIRALAQGGPSGWARMLRKLVTDLREGLLARRALPAIVIASAVVVAGHAATFVIAARTAGSTAPALQLLPLALLVLLATGIPLNIAGWGPREGAAAWAFGLAGLGAAQGVATAVGYGVMVLVANLPGAGVLIVDMLRRSVHDANPSRPWRPSARPCPDGAARG